MKSMKFFAAVIATVFTVNVNASAKPNHPNKLHNAKMEMTSPRTEVANSLIDKTVTTVSADKSVKFDYILDNEGRVKNRIQQAWNKSTGKWEPVAAYSIVYADKETVVTFAEYNRNRRTYTSNVQQIRFNADEIPFIFRIPTK
jgi:hypothetical protein